jgi:hypothetical protein
MGRSLGVCCTSRGDDGGPDPDGLTPIVKVAGSGFSGQMV